MKDTLIYELSDKKTLLNEVLATLNSDKQKIEKLEREIAVLERIVNEGRSDESVGEITVSVNADVDDAVTGFKRLQRELRKATQEVRELERVIESVDGNTSFNLDSGDAVFKDVKFTKPDMFTLDKETYVYDLSDVPTKELYEELSKRSGVSRLDVNHTPGFANIEIGDDANNWDCETNEYYVEGPANILVITDV